MSFLIDPRKTRLLPAPTLASHLANDTGASCASPSNELQDSLPPSKAAQAERKEENTRIKLVYPPPASTTKPLVVIPATVKRQETDTWKRPRHRSSVVLLGILLGTMAVFIIATVFVVPLEKDHSQPSQSLAESVNNWLSEGRIINPAEQIDPPTPTPALQTTEGYCGGSDLWGTCATAVTASGVMGTGQMQRPIRGAVITQVFGHPEYQLWCGCWKPHSGIDLAAPYGTPIMAADNGQVIWTGWDWSGLGWAVKINHGRYIATVYGHLQRFIVSVGQNVTKGQIIGYEGSTGASTGPHLHFMVLYNNIWVNPLDYVQLP